MSAELLMFLLITKHLIFDFFLQFPRHYLNKGTYGKWGGIEHAGLQAIGTWLILSPVAALIDFIIHYHVDWAKMKLGAIYGWKPDNAKFWWALGLDQYAHYVTYIGLILWFK